MANPYPGQPIQPYGNATMYGQPQQQPTQPTVFSNGQQMGAPQQQGMPAGQPMPPMQPGQPQQPMGMPPADQPARY